MIEVGVNTYIDEDEEGSIIVETEGNFGIEYNFFDKVDTYNMFMLNNKESFMEMLRLVYLSGVNDQEEDCASWCEDGSKARVEELFEELKEEEL